MFSYSAPQSTDGGWDMERKTKIAIGLPTNRGIKPQTAVSIAEMVANSDYDFHFIISTKGYTCAENRNWITAQAIKNDCTHLLLLDDDMVYEKDSINRLIAHDRDIVGATYSVRSIEFPEGVNPLVIEYFEKEDDKKLEGEELFKCKALGGGLLLFKLDILEKFRKPLFWYKVHDVGMITMSNDWWFCESAREAGHDVWCDPSLRPKHIGDFEY